eukprot:249734-Rhodomonas_salina.6
MSESERENSEPTGSPPHAPTQRSPSATLVNLKLFNREHANAMLEGASKDHQAWPDSGCSRADVNCKKYGVARPWQRIRGS